MAYHVEEVDSIRFSVLVNDEIDPFSPSPNVDVKYPAPLMGIPLTPLEPGERGRAESELRMDSICCGAHGLSLVITTESKTHNHTLLFDAGPEEGVFESNAKRMRLDLEAIEHIHLSHWHRDHSGGLPRAISMVSSARKAANKPNVVMDVHPDRPDYRGMDVMGRVISMEADPSFEAMESAGAKVTCSREAHTVLNDQFLVSGEVPRLTDYEFGIRGGVRFDAKKAEWEKDELIKDERFVVCNLKGKGLIVFAGCSHPGIVNICREAIALTGGKVPLYAVVGGFHLADGDPVKLRRSFDDIKALDPKIFMPAHCTGWRFCFLIEKEMPGSYVPCFGGTSYTMEAKA